MNDICCVVDCFCTAPAMEPQPRLRAECFACGQKVCLKCSSRRDYYSYGKVRLCNTCQVQYDGNREMVIRRLYRLAGY